MDIFLREQGIFRWGGFTLDPARRSLCLDGTRIKLAERLFDVLLYLVAHHGRVVDREELLQAAWAGRTVEDNNVGQAIFELRKALKAGGPTQSIVTVPGRGFRFAEPVVFESSPLPDLAAGSPALPAAPRWQSHVPLGVALLALLLAGISLGFWAREAPAPPAAPVPATAFAPPAHSVAVLAFDNLSGDPNQAYVSDGLSEQLIDSLTRIDAMQVAGRASSFSFRTRHATIGEIARALNVAAVLGGSIRRADRRLVVTAELTSALTGFNLWSRTYDRDAGDIVAVQTNIARAVAQSLQVSLLGGDDARLTLGGTSNATAYDFYLHGLRLERAARNTADHRAALADFDHALALDPGFARAHCGRASTLSNLAMLSAVGSADAQHRIFGEALTAADRAVALAPALSQAHSARAWALNFGLLDHAAAEREMAQAQALTPGSANIEANYANIELAVGHVDVAVGAARRAAQIDPLALHVWGQLGRTLFMARRYDEAVQALHHAAALTDTLPPQMIGLLGGVLFEQGHPQAARTLCAPAASLEEEEVLAMADHSLGREADAAADLAKLRADQGDAGAFSYAEIYAQWGRKADALTWLQNAARLHDPGVAEAAIDPMLDPIRNEPQFRQIQTQLADANLR